MRYYAKHPGFPSARRCPCLLYIDGVVRQRQRANPDLEVCRHPLLRHPRASLIKNLLYRYHPALDGARNSVLSDGFAAI